jgi:hypothetical protein
LTKKGNGYAMTPKLAVLVEVEILAYKAFKLGLLMSGW